MNKYIVNEKIRLIFIKFYGVLCYTYPSVIVTYSRILRNAGLVVTNEFVRSAFHKAEDWAFSRKRAGFPFNEAEIDQYKKIFFKSMGAKKSKIDEYDSFLANSLEESEYWTKNLKMAPGVETFLKKVKQRI